MEKLTKEQMKNISLGIAAEMTAKDRAERLGDNGKTGDQLVVVWRVRGVRVASTNGDPVWEEQDVAEFEGLLESEGIALETRGRKSVEPGIKRPLVSVSLRPDTLAAIDADRRGSESRGQVLDRWAVELKKTERNELVSLLTGRSGNARRIAMEKFSSKMCSCTKNCTHTFYVWATDNGRLTFVDGHAGGTNPCEKFGVKPPDFFLGVQYVGPDEERAMLRDLAALTDL